MLSSTIKNPDVKFVIRCVSTELHSNLLDNREDEKLIDSKSDLYFFNEEKYITENPSNFDEGVYHFFVKYQRLMIYQDSLTFYIILLNLVENVVLYV